MFTHGRCSPHRPSPHSALTLALGLIPLRIHPGPSPRVLTPPRPARRLRLTPPPTFHRFRYTRKNDVHFVDEYDYLNESIAPFRGLSGEVLRQNIENHAVELGEVTAGTR